MAVVGSLLASSLGRSAGVHTALSTHAGWLVLAGCGVVVLVLGQVVTTGWAHRTAESTAHELNPEFLEGPA